MGASLDYPSNAQQKQLPPTANLPQSKGKVLAQPTSSQTPPKRFTIPVGERGLRPLAQPFSVVGEVVDSWCYASQVMGSGRGEAHKPCGLACAYGGVTMGIVDDTGKLYIAAKSKGFTGCKDLLVPYMAKRVKVTGWLATKGGSNILKIQSVELAMKTAGGLL